MTDRKCNFEARSRPHCGTALAIRLTPWLRR